MAVALSGLVPIGTSHAAQAPEPPDGEPWHLEWRAPPPCPAEGEVRREIESYWAGSRSPKTDLRVRGSVRREASGLWSLQLTVALPSGSLQRTLEAERCALLATATAVVVAVVADPGVVLDRMSSQQPTSASARKATDDDRATEVPRASSRRRRIDGSFGASGFVEYGALPGAGPGLGGFAGLWVSSFRVELTGAYVFPRSLRSEPASLGVGAELRLGAGGVRGCYAPSVPKVRFPICAGTEVGVMTAVGTGPLVQARTVRSLWSAGSASLGVTYVPTRTIGIFVTAEAIVPFVRPGFEVIDLGPLFRARAAGVRGHAGFEVRWP